MDTISYQYLDHDFDPAQTSNYTLLVQADSGGLSFAVTDNRKLLLLSNRVGLAVLQHPAENNLLFSNYGERIIGLPFTGFTFVPLSLFNPDKIADFARFLDVKPGEKIFSQPMDEDNQVIFKVDADIASAIDGKFILRDIVFSPKGWITAAADDNPADTGLYLNITGNRVGILNFRDGKLRFFNRFEFETADELAYYAAFVTGELKQQPQDITVVVSGDVLTGDENMKRLSEFFGKVELNQLQPVALPDQAPPHTVLSLTALSLCGSSVAN